MKRISLIVCFVLVIVLLCSCGKKNSSDTVSETQNSGSSNNSVKASEISSTSNGSSNTSLPYVYKDPGKAIAFNYNDDVQAIEKGFAMDFERAGDFSIVFNRSSNAMSLPLDKINDELLFTYAFAMNSIAGEAKEFVIDSSKEMTINNIKVLRMVGHISFQNYKMESYYMVGYTFEKDGVVCQMIGCVSSDDQSQTKIDEVTKRVDAMMQTLRDKR